ncbi:MAG: DUF4234 domain-containing protein [Desulfobacteraceae bacterium]|nr:DUF4234 domain-containing protein [Desulfobacteraceae bacterium]
MQCPICKEQIRANTTVCEHCGFLIADAPPETLPGTDEVLPDRLPAPAREKPIKRTGVLWTLIFAVITLGIYIPIWFINRKEGINSLSSPHKLKPGTLVLAMVLYCLSVALGFSSGIISTAGVFTDRQDLVVFAKTLELFSNLSALAGGILVASLSVIVRKILQQHCDAKELKVRTSAIAAFFLQIFYLQYKINRIFPARQDTVRKFY